MGDVHAAVINSDIDSSGNFTLTADSTMDIDAIVVAGSVALSATGGDSIAGSGAGAGTGNTSQFDLAYAQTTSHNDGLKAGTITVRATNASSIDVTTGAASVAAVRWRYRSPSLSRLPRNQHHPHPQQPMLRAAGADDNGSV